MADHPRDNRGRFITRAAAEALAATRAAEALAAARAAP